MHTDSLFLRITGYYWARLFALTWILQKGHSFGLILWIFAIRPVVHLMSMLSITGTVQQVAAVEWGSTRSIPNVYNVLGSRSSLRNPFS